MANILRMNFKDWVNGQRGRSLAIARALGVTQPVVSDWVTGKKRVPLERCVQIERATKGEVTRQSLRPDDWQDMWPELASSSPPAHPTAAAIDIEVSDQERRETDVRRDSVRRESERREVDARRQGGANA